MLKLTIYGLVGLTAMLVIAFYFACADEFSSAREKPSFNRINNAHSNDSQMMGIGQVPGNPRRTYKHRKIGQTRVRSACPAEFQL